MKSLTEQLKEIENQPIINDLIQDLFPDSATSYMLICGRSGIGKTFLALNLLYCLASGTPFLSFKTKQCKVGYLSMEGSKVKIAARFTAISEHFPSCNGNISWEHTTAIKLNKDGFEKLSSIVQGQDVVLVDTLRYLVPGDYNKPSDAQAFLESLLKLQNTCSTRLILLHHIRKPDRRLKIHPEDIIFEVKGPTEYVEGATTVLLLERALHQKDNRGKFVSSNDDNKVLYFAKVKDSPTDLRPLTLHFNRETMIFEPQTTMFDEEDM